MRTPLVFSRVALVLALLAALAGSAVQVTPVYAASIVVNTNADTDANDGVCTLREAIIAAVTDLPSGAQPGECAAGSVGRDTISFAGNYTITIGSQLPFITNAITIAGKGAANTIIQASTMPNDAEWRVFQVTLAGNLILDGVAVRNGRCNGTCTSLGGVFSNAGGAIYNNGTLTVNNSIISANRGANGGGIYSTGMLTVNNSTISANSSSLSAGGIYSSGTLTVTNSTISGNDTINFGGGMHNSGTATVTNSTFTDNTSELAGGIYNTGTLTVTHSTFARNTVNNDGSGGGIVNSSSGNLTVANSTFTDNTASAGGGISNAGTLNVTNSTFAYNHFYYDGGDAISNSGVAVLKNTILASNSGDNCYGRNSVTDGGNNLDSGNTCGFGSGAGSLSDTDPMLGPLANNGGPTQTMKLLAGSPAINNGRDTFCSAAPVSGVDQRGVTRPQGAHCDIGAYEYSGTFADVPLNYWAWSYVEGLYNAGITGGCVVNPLQYCPEATVTRAEMAVFLLRGYYGGGWTPPSVGTSTGFADVPTTYWAAAWIKQLAAEGITGGCGFGNYCPESPVTRAQMAVFLLRSYYDNPNYTPPPVGSSTGFSDVPPNYWAAAWIKQLVAEGITSGCGTGLYCPDAPVTRAQMAVFLVRTFYLSTP